MSQHVCIPLSALSDDRLSPAAFRVLGALWSFANRDGECWPSTKAISSRCSIARSSVCKYLNELVSLGYCQIDPTFSDGGAKRANFYHLRRDPDVSSGYIETADICVGNEQQEVAPQPRDIDVETADSLMSKPRTCCGRNHGHGHVETADIELAQIELSQDSPLNPPKVGKPAKSARRAKKRVDYDNPPEGWEEFWSIEKTKEGKKDAFAAYQKALKVATAEKIIAGYRRYIENKPYWRAWKTPAAWLNGERWNDIWETTASSADDPGLPLGDYDKEVQHRARVALFREDGFWSPMWGPKPPPQEPEPKPEPADTRPSLRLVSDRQPSLLERAGR